MKVLFISPWYPYPMDNGAKIRISNLLSALCDRHRVTLIAAHDPKASPPLSSSARLCLCEKVVPLPWRPEPVLGVRRLASYIWPRPEWVFFTPSEAMRAAVAREIETSGYDLIIIYELSTACYLPRRARIPRILEDVELGGYLVGHGTERLGARVRRHLFIWKLRRSLRSLLPHVTACTVPSSTERSHLMQFAPKAPSIEVIPNCLDGARYSDISMDSQPETLIFTGALTFEANYNAITFFLRAIYPLIKEQLPHIKLSITGRHKGIEVSFIEQDPSIRLTGFVEDVRPLIANSWVSIVPLLTGGGSRFKILEAMALGTPVVSTSKGAEGLDVVSGEHLLIADTPQGFAEAVVRLCRDRDLHVRLSAAGRRFVLERHTWQAVAPRYLDFVERVVQNYPVTA